MPNISTARLHRAVAYYHESIHTVEGLHYFDQPRRSLIETVHVSVVNDDPWHNNDVAKLFEAIGDLPSLRGVSAKLYAVYVSAYTARHWAVVTSMIRRAAPNLEAIWIDVDGEGASSRAAKDVR